MHTGKALGAEKVRDIHFFLAGNLPSGQNVDKPSLHYNHFQELGFDSSER